MISRQNLIYALIGNSYPKGKFIPVEGVVEYSYRESDIEDLGYRDYSAFLDYIQENILEKPHGYPVFVQYEHVWGEWSGELVCEIEERPSSGIWKYITYFRQQRNEVSVPRSDTQKLIDLLKKEPANHKITNSPYVQV